MQEHEDILREAVCLNIIKVAEEMKESSNEKEMKDEDIHVAILANLQQVQDQEAEILLRDLSDKVSELDTLLEYYFISKIDPFVWVNEHALLPQKVNIEFNVLLFSLQCR